MANTYNSGEAERALAEGRTLLDALSVGLPFAQLLLAKARSVSPSDAEDVLQDVWLSLLSGGPFEAKNPKGYLMRAVHYQALRSRRSDHRRRAREIAYNDKE